MSDTPKVVFKTGSRPGIIILALILMIPALAAFFTDHEARSSWENRPLASWSSVREAESAKQLFSSLEDYLDDHIGFALALNRIYRQVQFYLFADSPIANVNLGEDDFVFLNAHGVNHPYAQLVQLCEPRPYQVTRSKKAIETLAHVLAERQIRMTFAVVPSKPVLYPDRLPDTVPRHIREACLGLNPEDNIPGQLVQRLRAAPLQVYYPVETMIALRDEKEFYPPQNFHANSMINHVFAQGLLLELGIEPGNQYSDGAHLTKIKADMTMLGFEREATAWSYPYFAYQVEKQFQEPQWVLKTYERAQDFFTYTTGNPASGRTAILLSNSFGAYIAPHLAPGFKTLYHINLVNLRAGEARPFFEDLIAKTRPTEVIYLLHDGALPNQQLEMLANGIKPLQKP